MAITLLDAIIRTDYGQFDLVWEPDGGFDGVPDRFFAGQVNGWVGAADPSGVYLCLARRSGGSRIRIVLEDVEPAFPSPEYDDVVEVSTVVPEGAEPGWLSWAGESGGDLALPSGSYRIRVSANGRDAGAADEFSDEILDSYLVQLWPAAAQPDAILRSESENGRYWHREWGNRR